MKNSARGDSSTGSELKAVEEACRETSRTVEPCVLSASAVSQPRVLRSENFRPPIKSAHPEGIVDTRRWLGLD